MRQTIDEIQYLALLDNDGDLRLIVARNCRGRYQDAGLHDMSHLPVIYRMLAAARAVNRFAHCIEMDFGKPILLPRLSLPVAGHSIFSAKPLLYSFASALIVAIQVDYKS